jgi:hypothetical protein
MRRFLAMICLVLGASVAVAMPAAAAPAPAASPARAPANPSPAKIRAAVKKAERSHTVWATVNVCNSRGYHDDLGIRGQMPALGFAAWLSMDVKLFYYARSQKRFVPVPTSGTKLVRLGRSSSGLQQGGALFQFSPHEPTLKATITFIWRRSGQLIGRTTRTTTGGHRNADFASPPHYSAATCTIK